MAYWEVEVETTYRGVVTVEATTARQAMAMAERGPGAWLNGPRAEAEDYAHTEAVIATKRGGDDDGVDDLQAYKERIES